MNDTSQIHTTVVDNGLQPAQPNRDHTLNVPIGQTFSSDNAQLNQPPAVSHDETDATKDEDSGEQVGQSASADPRHQKRVALMQQLFAYSFGDTLDEFTTQFESQEDLQAIITDIPELDKVIQQAAPERPLIEINKVDLAILRLIMFESNHKKTPKKVLINEGIELAKEYGTESSPRFVNGVLAKLFAL
jgi:transcription antitermination protein NusB